MVTITDVAKRAGVAPVTVSRVLNAAPNVNSVTRERVEQAIADLGYVPSVVARSLRSKRTHTLAFIVPDITNAFWTTVARGVEDAAHQHGYSVLLCNTDEDLTKQGRYLEIMVSQRVDGVIIAPCDMDANKLAALRDHHIATVIIDRRVDGWDVDTVYCDSVSGAYALTRHLIGLGHRRIAMLSGPVGAATAEDRLEGYRLALQEAGIALDPHLIRRGGFSTATGAALAGQLLDEGARPTAIFAANNAIALGVVDAAAARGLRIPGDIALVCFDDYPYISSFFPFLTVVSQPAYDMGANAAGLLLARLASPAAARPRCVVLPVRLIVRRSCGSTSAAGASSSLHLPLEGLGVGHDAQAPAFGGHLPGAG
jgi:LacI family transcriptional regulator